MIFLTLNKSKVLAHLNSLSDAELDEMDAEYAKLLVDSAQGKELFTQTIETFNEDASWAVNFDNLIDQDGVEYDMVKFQVSSIVVREGVTYLSDGGVAVAAFAFVDDLCEITKNFLGK